MYVVEPAYAHLLRVQILLLFLAPALLTLFQPRLSFHAWLVIVIDIHGIVNIDRIAGQRHSGRLLTLLLRPIQLIFFLARRQLLGTTDLAQQNRIRAEIVGGKRNRTHGTLDCANPAPTSVRRRWDLEIAALDHVVDCLALKAVRAFCAGDGIAEGEEGEWAF